RRLVPPLHNAHRLIFSRHHHVHDTRRASLYHQPHPAMPLFSPKTHTHPITLGRNRRKLEFPRAEVDVSSCPEPVTRITVAPSTGVFPASRTTPTILVVANRGRANSTKSRINDRRIQMRTGELIDADYRPRVAQAVRDLMRRLILHTIDKHGTQLSG